MEQSQKLKRTRARAKQLLERSLFDLQLAGDAMKASGVPDRVIARLRRVWVETRHVRREVESADVCTDGGE